MAYDYFFIKLEKSRYYCNALENGRVKPEAIEDVKEMIKKLNGTQNWYLKYNSYIDGPISVFSIVSFILYAELRKRVFIIIALALFFVFILNLFIYCFWKKRNGKKYNKIIGEYREKLGPYYIVVDKNGEYSANTEEPYRYTETNWLFNTIKLVPIEQAERIRTLHGDIRDGNNAIEEVEPSYHTVNDPNMIIPIHQVNLKDLPNYNSQIRNQGIPDLKEPSQDKGHV